jgi:hypothetical protein
MIQRMKLRRVWQISVLAATAFAWLPVQASKVEQPVPSLSPAELPESEFDALVDKINLYVRALNGVSSVRRSHERYTSWIDEKKGFTGNERYISYGVYEIGKSSVEEIQRAATKGPQMKPSLRELDSVIVRLAEIVTSLVPLVKKAHEYYEQEAYRSDGAKLGQELHVQMMPLFDRTFAAERHMRRQLEALKVQLDQRQLRAMEAASGRNYYWHVRRLMIAAKGVVGLLPENPNSPTIDADDYQARFSELEAAYDAFQTFASDRPKEVKKVRLASSVDSSVKEFVAAAKFLHRSLEAQKLDRDEYIDRVVELAKTYNDLVQRTNKLR